MNNAKKYLFILLFRKKKFNMSKFFATGTDSESENSSEEEQVVRPQIAAFSVRHIFI